MAQSDLSHGHVVAEPCVCALEANPLPTSPITSSSEGSAPYRGWISFPQGCRKPRAQDQSGCEEAFLPSLLTWHLPGSPRALRKVRINSTSCYLHLFLFLDGCRDQGGMGWCPNVEAPESDKGKLCFLSLMPYK